MLILDGVTFQYGTEGTSFEFTLKIAPGEIVAVMGPSGSGKSTLLDLVAGFQRPISGQIAWKGAPFHDRRPEQRPITILFQKNALFEHLTVEANVGLGLDPSLKLSTDDKRVIQSVLDQVGLNGFGDRTASTLSGGQQQRVALARSLARALIQDRPILLLDEPFNGLDAETRHAMLDLVLSITQDKHLATLLVTHDPEDADRIADRTLVVKNGRLTGS